MNNKYLLLVITLLTLLATSCGKDNKKEVVDDSPTIAVQVKTIKQEQQTSFLSSSGKVEAVKSANLSTRMMGFVDKIHVQVGDKVKKGQLLLSINNADISAKGAQVNAGITEAKAAFNNTEKDYNRFTSLFNEQSASQKELDDITANYTMAKARLEAANQMKNEVNAQLSYANIRSPFSGVITNKFIKEGDMANPSMPLLEVEAPGKYQVVASVPESEILKIKMNSVVNVLIKSLNQNSKGKVVEISTSAKNTGGQYLVKVVLDENKSPVLSGMFATVQFPVEQKAASSSIMIPKQVLINKGQLSGVYTVSQSNTALLRWLQLGRTVGEQVEVLSGLTIDEQYITNSEGKLFNGVKILIQ